MLKRFSGQFSLPRIRRIFWQAKFPVRKRCLRCNSREVSVVSDSRMFCRKCRYIFSVFTQTYLARTRLGLDSWYELIWWFVYDFTANRSARETKIPQRLVHRCFSIIRKTIYDYEEAEMENFFGEVEVDETYIGPKFKNRRRKTRERLRRVNAVKRGRGAKILQQPVFGIYQRNGKVYVKFVKDVAKKTLQDIIKGRIVLDSEVYSDMLLAYQGLKGKGYQHETIDHGKQEYCKEKRSKKIHINGIEGFWGYMKEHLLKHHGVARHNLILYVKEQEFRFNHRHLSTEEMVSKIINILMKSASSND